MTEPPHVLIAGGGPAAIEAALALQRLAEERVRITLASESETLVYRPTATVGPFGFPPPQRFSLAGLTAERGFGFVRATVRAVDAAARWVDAGGESLGYDALVVAIGANRETAIPARWARECGLAIEPWVVTHEDQALGVFGAEASRAVVALLDDASVRLWTGAAAELVEDGSLWMSLEGGMPVALAVALPRPVGRRLPGVPHDERGFVAVDALGRVPGLPDVYAAGDMTTRPLRQGGLATQQADSIATAIAAWSGAPVTPRPYRPVLRAVLLTGGAPLFLRRGAAEPFASSSLAADTAAWWPPHKIAGRELAPYLESHAELLHERATRA